AEATVTVDNLPLESPAIAKDTVVPKTAPNEQPQNQLLKKASFLPQFPSGVHVTIGLINEESLYGEWFYENEGFLAIKLSEDSSLYRRGQIVHLNTAHIISIS
ncbi:MAG TPA: hypothetical protein VEC37_18940, partial [Bacillota bacterium]|nr:hypothetical protein [Bacillota bacterium]